MNTYSKVISQQFDLIQFLSRNSGNANFTIVSVSTTQNAYVVVYLATIECY